MKTLLKSLLFFTFFLTMSDLIAWEGMPMPGLHVEGRYLKDSHGNIVNLHGFAQTYSPWFNQQGRQWSNYNITNCLKFNKAVIDSIMDAGWDVNMMRLHMDPYWSNLPNCNAPNGEASINCFRESRFKSYLNSVFIPMAEYAISKGLYVIMRPPGVCPEEIAVGDEYNNYLIKVWGHVANHAKLKNNPNIMFELANEPVRILGPNGDYGSGSQGHFDNLKTYFQVVVDTIRNSGANNVLWIPGLGYQSQYKGYVVNPIEGENIGYAVHIYPGWFGSAEGYDVFKPEWDKNLKPVTDFAPIFITEMDWAPEVYNSSWGKHITGVAGGYGFGANFKKLADEAGNVGWLIFTEPHLMGRFKDEAPAEGEPYVFLNDPEACPWPTYHWYKEYKEIYNPCQDFINQSNSDNNDGTYTNPVIYADFTNPDVVYTDNIYYMASGSYNLYEEVTLLKSKDLVNWEFCQNPLELVTGEDAENLYNKEKIYKGHYNVTGLKYFDGDLYLVLTDEDNVTYILTSSNPEFNWNVKRLDKTYINPDLFFDANGSVYLISGNENLSIVELNRNFEELTTPVVIAEAGVGYEFEGAHLYENDGQYVITASKRSDEISQVILKSETLTGTYQQVATIGENVYSNSLVKNQYGEWWNISVVDHNGFGPVVNLQPVTWGSDFPVSGDNGVFVSSNAKPQTKYHVDQKILSTNDSFREPKLSNQWSWYNKPDNFSWSLYENPGNLTLKNNVVVTELKESTNILTQKIFGFSDDEKVSMGTVKIDISKMADGDCSGLALIRGNIVFIGVEADGSDKKLILKNDNSIVKEEIVACGAEIYLRAIINKDGSADFAYSVDNETYNNFGDSQNSDINKIVNNRFAIFNYATKQTGGSVDIDWFSTEDNYDESMFYNKTSTLFSSVDEITVEEIYFPKSKIEGCEGTVKTIDLMARFKDGHTETISLKATFTNTNPEVAHISNGNIVLNSNGETLISASYKDAVGNTFNAQIEVEVSYFPFSDDAFSATIYGTGTYVESTKTLTTTQWGAGGWWYNNGINLSGYKYLVVKLAKTQTCSAQLRVFDNNSYWTEPANYSFGSSKQVVVNLQSMKKDNGAKCNPSNIYGVVFWSHGGSPIQFEDAYVTNEEDYSKPLALDEVGYEEETPVDVYTITGIRIKSNVLKSEIVDELEPGIYLIGNEKVMIP